MGQKRDPRRVGRVLRGLAALAALGVAGCARDRPPGPPPHIILITADALRADHLSLNGYPRPTSPTIDELARKAWTFTNAVTVTPKTGPSFATMFTGHHPEQHLLRSNFDAIPKSMPVLAEHLERRGYRTAAFVGNPVLRSAMGYARGFHVYERHTKNTGGVTSVNDGFKRWVRLPWDAPTFVWLHYMDPHGPYTPPAEFESLFVDDEWAQSDTRVSLEPTPEQMVDPEVPLGAVPEYQRLGDEDRVAAYVARYDAEIRYMDSALAEVLALLREHHVYDESVIIFTSDHGESLGEHGLFFEHGFFAYDPSLRVPLIIKLPRQEEGRVVPEQVSNLDFLPTVAALAGLSFDTPVAGVDVLEPVGERAPLLIQSSDRHTEQYYGLRSLDWKFLVRSRDGAEELYDLEADREERHDLSDRALDRTLTLRGMLAEALRTVREGAVEVPGQAPPDDPETLELLRSLGYVQ